MLPVFSKWLPSGRSRSNEVQAHMTFGQSTLSRTVNRTGAFLKKQLWIWPIIAMIILSIAGYLVRSSINLTIKNSVRSELTTLLNIERAMLEKWFKIQESNAITLANDPQIRKLVVELVASSKASDANDTGDKSTLDGRRVSLELQAKLKDELDVSMTAHEFEGFVLADRNQRIVAAQTQELIGSVFPQLEQFLSKSLEGKPTVSVPFPSITALKDRAGRVRTDTPTMFVTAPVVDDNLQVIAILAMRIRPEREFTEILQLGRLGETGETYAVNRHGLMVSNSRFDDQLILLGVLPDQDGASSILKVQVRDPGGHLASGFRPKVRRSELPLTEICAAAVSGSTGVNMEGYRDYQGAQAIGAWTWIPEYNLALITEINTAEAYRPLTILKWSFYSLYAMLVVAAIAIFIFTLIVARLQREAQKSAIEAKQLGQYKLDKLLGAGAIGVVYKGHHAMLRRPTAIKMLQVDKVSEAAIGRFEREVQITCNLNHPNTIAIYDYGRTPEGVFYYAMEYLDGIDLQTLVDRYGPQPEGRVIHILQQVCGSLFEAHSQGLVHRDIKPANIMLNRRGSESDVVKVLDFGLVKSLDDAVPSDESSGLSGTPLYMSPESIQSPNSVDGRCDLYSLGAVGYFLLTGKTVFQAETLSELCKHHIASIPESLSKRLGRTISEGLESAILACLEKSRARRPQTARDLSNLLKNSGSPTPWSQDDADAWWGRHERDKAKSNNLGSSTMEAFSNQSGTNTSAQGTRPPSTIGAAFDQTIAPESQSGKYKGG
jgi:serine/threonine protein kinase